MDLLYGYYCTIKDLAEEFGKQLTCLAENIEKYLTFTVPIEVTIIDKNWEQITKSILYIFNLLIEQDLWQVHSWILVIILLKKFIKLNTTIKNVKLEGSNVNTVTAFLNTQTLNMI